LAKLFGYGNIQIKEGVLNNLELYFDNEPARHKLLEYKSTARGDLFRKISRSFRIRSELHRQIRRIVSYHLDGSARYYVEEIQKVGIEEQQAERRYFSVKKKMEFYCEASDIYFASAGISVFSSRSTLTILYPVFSAAGLKVAHTSLPVCKPLPFNENSGLKTRRCLPLNPGLRTMSPKDPYLWEHLLLMCFVSLTLLF